MKKLITMKKTWLIACLSIFFAVDLYAQQPFSVAWETKGTSSSDYGIQKTITGNALGISLETTEGDYGALGTLSLYSYNNNTAVASVSGLAVGEAWGRYRATSTAPCFTVADINTNEYAQYIVESSSDRYMKINDIKIAAVGGSTGNVRLVVKYSKDGVNFMDMPQSATYYDADGNASAYAANSAATAIPLISNLAGTALPQDKRTIVYVNLGVKLDKDAGEKFYLRVYPFLTATTTSARFIFLRSTIFSGITTDEEETLPLKFVSFTAKPNPQNNSVVELKWQTTNEVNTENFLMERKTDATEFQEIGVKASKNTSGLQNYAYTDNNAPVGKVYYRLKQVDKDGKHQYSDIAVVEVKNRVEFNIYPNPAQNVLNVQLGSENITEIRVLNTNGQKLLSTPVSSRETNKTINISSLSKGTYILQKIENSVAKGSKVFIKQ